MERAIKISVVIPVYNTEEYLEECLDSLYVQDFKEIEYILVDDGSKDSSLDICRKYAKKDERFVVIHKENGGPSSARNMALEVARGEYISFVDSDDSLREDAYSIINKRLIENNNPDILVFGANLFPEDAPDYLRYMVSPRNVTYNEFLPEILYEEVGSRPFLWLQIIKKSLITENNIKMDESMNLGEDQLFQIQLFPFAKRIAYTDDKLYNYRWSRPNSLMKDYGDKMQKKLLAHVKIIDKVLDAIFTEAYSRQMQIATLTWSVFFIWGDVVNLLEYKQVEICSALTNVWEKHNASRFYNELGVWCKLRYDQLLILGETDKDKKIEKMQEANEKLEARLEEIKSTKEGKRLEKSRTTKCGKARRLFGKFFEVLKREGLIRATKKALKKIKQKLFK